MTEPSELVREINRNIARMRDFFLYIRTHRSSGLVEEYLERGEKIAQLTFPLIEELLQKVRAVELAPERIEELLSILKDSQNDSQN